MNEAAATGLFEEGGGEGDEPGEEVKGVKSEEMRLSMTQLMSLITARRVGLSAGSCTRIHHLSDTIMTNNPSFPPFRRHPQSFPSTTSGWSGPVVLIEFLRI